jgi:prephenate dehydrogenase
VVGAGRNGANLRLALETGVIDSIAPDAVAAAHGADLVLLAAPVAQFPKLFRDVSSVLAPKAIVTDGGSTKRDVVVAARAAMGKKLAQFVPAHPIAGAEKSGAGAASADLFRGKRVIITPLPENSEATVKRVRDAWSACGARITPMDPEEHDTILAAVSHLPHVLAYALVHDLAGRDNAAELFAYAAGGFRDFTRIASSHPEMWRDICIANRDRLLQELDRYRRELDSIGRLLQAGDAAGLERVFAEARESRSRWLNGEFES